MYVRVKKMLFGPRVGGFFLQVIDWLGLLLHIVPQGYLKALELLLNS